MKAFALKTTFVAAALLGSLAVQAADITLNPTFGQNGNFAYNVCDIDPGTTAPECSDMTGPTTFTVEFTSAGLLGSSGSTSVTPTNAGSFTTFDYEIRDPSNNLVATGTPQNPLDLAVIAGEYTVTVNWVLNETTNLSSANWQVILTTSPAVVPEPGSLALLGLGLLGIGAARRRKA